MVLERWIKREPTVVSMYSRELPCSNYPSCQSEYGCMFLWLLAKLCQVFGSEPAVCTLCMRICHLHCPCRVQPSLVWLWVAGEWGIAHCEKGCQHVAFTGLFETGSHAHQGLARTPHCIHSNRSWHHLLLKELILPKINTPGFSPPLQ